MPAPRRLLVLLACAAGAWALSAPVASAAASEQGVVLSATGHGVRLVDKSHRVGDVHVSSTRGLRRGDVVSVRKSRAQVSGHVRKLTFLGRVVRSSARGAVVRLGDGSSLTVGAGKPRGHRARSAANVAVDFQRLASGQSVLVTLAADAQGNVAIKIRVLSAATDIGDGELHATGVVTDDEGEGAFAIEAEDGGELSFDDPQQLFDAADAGWCDVVDVTFHKSDGDLIADELRVTGQSEEGDCAEGDFFDEVDGTVAALATDRSSLTLEPDDARQTTTYPVDDPSLLDGVEVGDDVAVTLDEDGTAVDVEVLDWSEDPGDDGDEE